MNKNKQWEEKLQASGYRITAPRKVVIDILLNSRRALQPAEVYHLCLENYPGIGLVTVYRTLDCLEELNLVQRVHQEDGCHMLMPAADGHEHYLVCTSCGSATLFEGDDLDELNQSLERKTGYRVSTHWLQFFGLCPQCQRNAGETTHA